MKYFKHLKQVSITAVFAVAATYGVDVLFEKFFNKQNNKDEEEEEELSQEDYCFAAR